MAGVDVGKIMAYENDEMTSNEVIDFFAGLIESRVAWQLQGSYGRTATALINGGYIDQSGKVLAYIDDDDSEEEDEDEDEDTYSASYNPMTGQWDEIVLF